MFKWFRSREVGSHRLAYNISLNLCMAQMKPSVSTVLACFLTPIAIGQGNAWAAQNVPSGPQQHLLRPTNFHAAEAGIQLCKVLLVAPPKSFRISQNDDIVTVIAHMASLGEAEQLRERLGSRLLVESTRAPNVGSRNGGITDLTFNGRLVAPPSEVEVSRDRLPRADLLPIAEVNQAGLDSGLVFERFWPSERVDVGPYVLTTVQFSASGTCEQLLTMLERLRPHADSVDFLDNQIVLESTLARSLRWSATLKLRSQK